MTAGDDDSNVVRRLYLLALGRAADHDGLVNARAVLANGGRLEDLARGMLDSEEGRAWRLGLGRLVSSRWSPPYDETLAALAKDPSADIEAVVAHAIADLPNPVPAERTLAAMAREALLAEARTRPHPPLWIYGWKAFSQADEDGILAEIFRRLSVTAGTFLEIGASDGLENITTHWLLAGWRGVWVEGDAALVERARSKFAHFLDDDRLQIINAFVDPAALAPLHDRIALEAPVDLLSVDIDGNDFAVTAACLQTYRPKVLVVEYNPKFGPELDWVMPYDQQHRWGEDDWYGASLAAYTRLAKTEGMVLVGCNMLGSNAFYVRRELAGMHFGDRHGASDHYEPARYQLLPAFLTGHPVNRDRTKRFRLPS